MENLKIILSYVDTLMNLRTVDKQFNEIIMQLKEERKNRV